MVATRSQVRRGQASLARMNNEIGRRRRGMQAFQNYVKRYRPGDPHHRHRIEDNQPKTQQVVSYRRRT